MNYETDILADRIKKCVKLAGNAETLSQKIGIPRRTLDTYISGQVEPKIGKVIDIANAVGVDFEWLATGKGPMRHTDEPQACPSDEFIYIRKARARLSGGDGYWAQEDFYSELYSFRLDWIKTVVIVPSKAILMDVTGNSMAPDIKDGDTAMIDTSRTEIIDGRVYAFADTGGKTDQFELKIKALYNVGDGENVLIESYNVPESLRTQTRPRASIKIMGEIVWIGRVLVPRQIL